MSDNTKDLGDSAKDSSDQDNILFILIGVKDILFGVTVISAIFYGLQDIPNLDFITSSFITLLVICLAIYLRQRQLTAGGDDQ
jgi:hypothetical protein